MIFIEFFTVIKDKSKAGKSIKRFEASEDGEEIFGDRFTIREIKSKIL